MIFYLKRNDSIAARIGVTNGHEVLVASVVSVSKMVHIDQWKEVADERYKWWRREYVCA